MPTVIKLSFPSTATVFVQAVSNASYKQVVTITPPSGTAAVFSGSGEYNAPMALTTQGFLTPHSGGQPSFVVPGSSGGSASYQVSVTANGNQSQVMGYYNTLLTPSSGQIVTGFVSSEDSNDNDWNDSVVNFVSYIPNP